MAVATSDLAAAPGGNRLSELERLGRSPSWQHQLVSEGNPTSDQDNH
jgi:hypothetical protein